jgi:hypothetical protein
MFTIDSRSPRRVNNAWKNKNALHKSSSRPLTQHQKAKRRMPRRVVEK